VSDFDTSGTAVSLFSTVDGLEPGFVLRLVEVVFLELSPTCSPASSSSSRPEFGENEFRCRELKIFAKPPNLRPGRGRSG